MPTARDPHPDPDRLAFGWRRQRSRLRRRIQPVNATAW